MEEEVRAQKDEEREKNSLEGEGVCMKLGSVLGKGGHDPSVLSDQMVIDVEEV